MGPHAEDTYDARADPMREASRVENSIAERPLCADFVAKVGCCRWTGGHFVKSGRL